MSRFSGPKFRKGYTQYLQDAWSRLPWPSPGKGEPDGNSALFRSYGSQVTRVSPEPDQGITRVPIVQGAPIPLDAPKTTLYWGILAVLNQRRMLCSQPFYGPMILESVIWEWNPQAGASNAVFSLFVSDSPDTTTALAPRPSGRDVWPSSLNNGFTGPDDPGTGVIASTQGGIRYHVEHPLNMRIDLDRFFLKPSLFQTAGTLITLDGWFILRGPVDHNVIGGPRSYSR